MITFFLKNKKVIKNLALINNIFWLGDSYTFGSGSIANTYRFSTLVSNYFGKTEYNFGSGGSTMQNYNSNSGINRLSSISSANNNSLIIIFLGLNDIIHQYQDIYPGLTRENFVRDANVITNYALTLTSKENIFVVGLPYQKTDAFTAELIPYSSDLSTMCIEKKISFIPIYEAMKNGGADSIMYDLYHPNDAGHAIIAGCIETKIKTIWI